MAFRGYLASGFGSLWVCCCQERSGRRKAPSYDLALPGYHAQPPVQVCSLGASKHYIIAFLKFWYDFIVGDDWTIGASITVAIALTPWLVRSNIQASWLLHAAAVLTLGLSLWRAARAE